MKKILLTMLGVAGILCSTSCSDEEIVSNVEGDAVAEFTVELSDGSDASRAISDGLTVSELYYEVYSVKNGVATLMPNLDAKVTLEKVAVDGKDVRRANVSLALVKGQAYDVVFWAQTPDAYVADDLQNITVAPTTANNESKDAFTAVYRTDKVTGPIKETIVLTRPFAQVNFGTLDVEAAKKAGITFSESQIVVSNAASTYNALTEQAAATGSELTFGFANVPDMEKEALVVSGTTYEYLATAYVLVPGDDTQKLSDLKMEIKTDLNENITLSVPNAPVQRNYRTNVLGNLLTNQADFNIVVDPIYKGDNVIMEEDVNSNESLEAALRKNEEHIVINLSEMGRSEKSEYVVNVGAWQEQYYFGGEKTKTIKINGNGHKINFKHNNGDWNYIRCVNDATKWIINDVELTNSGENDGPWNRHDIRFYNAVELNEVTSDKAIAVLKDAVLNKVNITEDTGVYALWITAEGQTVTVKNSNITALNGGRGIAIKDQYVDAPAKVKLNVENTTFKTAEKAAILVTSTAGAEITFSGNDISGVKADGINAVWIDEARADYADLVTVEGATVIVEPDENTVNPFEIEGNTVNVPAGTYSFPTKVAKGVTIVCEEGTVFSGTSSLNINGATVEGATFSNTEGRTVTGTINGTFKNCTFTGSNALRYCYAGETTLFEDCVFDGTVYGVHFDGGSNPVTLRRCTLSGFNAFGSAIELLTLEDCTFKSTGKSGYNGANLWGATKLINTKFEFDGKASTEWIGVNAADSKKIEFENCEVPEGKILFEYMSNYASGDKVTVDGVEYVLAEDAEGLTAALKGDVKNIYLTEGEVLEGTFSLSSEKTIFSAPSNKATIKGRIELINPNVKFDNVKFDYNDASLVEFSSAIKGNPKGHPAIVGVYGGTANFATFENCDFNFKSGYSVAVAPGAISHYGDVKLTLNNCTLDGNGNPIYAKTNVEMEGCLVKMYGNNAVLNLNYSAVARVVFKNNKVENKSTDGSKMYAMQFLSTNGKAYKNMYFDVQGNTGIDGNFVYGSGFTFENVTFAEGSETF